MKKVLITGATGFLGRGCLAELAARAGEVHAVARSDTSWAIPGIHVHQADLLDHAQTSALIASIQPSHLLHLAWITTPATYRSSPENLRWVEASLHLLRQFAEHGGDRVVMAGTGYEYDAQADYCHETATPLRPATLYGMCKMALAAMLNEYAQRAGLSSAWARLFFLYGPREHPQRLVASITRALLLGQPAACSLGTQQRDYLHADDAAAALVALLQSDVRGPINIASGEAVAVRTIVANIAATVGRPDLVRWGAVPTSPNETPLQVAEVGRLRDELGWSPRLDLQQGLADTVAWWRAAHAA